MAKLRLLVWLVLVGGTAIVLLGDLDWSTDDPAVATMSVVRALAGALAGYLTAATLAALVRLPAPSPAFVRRLVAGAVAGGLVVTPMTASAGEHERAPSPREAPVLRRVDATPTATPPTATPPTATPPTATPIATPPPDSATRPATVVVRPGDHLWAIAHRAVAAQLGREPDDAEVAPYWRQVVAANRDRLASRDPDVIFAGEVISLP